MALGGNDDAGGVDVLDGRIIDTRWRDTIAHWEMNL